MAAACICHDTAHKSEFGTSFRALKILRAAIHCFCQSSERVSVPVLANPHCFLYSYGAFTNSNLNCGFSCRSYNLAERRRNAIISTTWGPCITSTDTSHTCLCGCSKKLNSRRCVRLRNAKPLQWVVRYTGNPYGQDDTRKVLELCPISKRNAGNGNSPLWSVCRHQVGRR